MKRLFLMLALLGVMLFLWSPRAEAQHCHRARVVVHAPYVAKAVVVEKVIKAVPVYVAPDYYYSVGGGYRDALLADAVAYRVLAMQARLNAPGGPLPRVPAATPPSGAPGPSAPPPMAPANGGAVSAALAKVIEGRCLKCHADTKNGINLSAANLPNLSRAEWLECSLRVSIDGEGTMPKGGPALSGEEASLFASQALAAKRK